MFSKLYRTVSIQAVSLSLTFNGSNSSNNKIVTVVMVANTYSSGCTMQDSMHLTCINLFDPLTLLGMYFFY